METQHKSRLLAVVLLIVFLLHLVSANLAVPLSNEPAISVYTGLASLQDLSIQGSRGNWEIENDGRSSDDERGRKVVIGRKLLQVEEIDDYSPPGPNPTHDPAASPPPPI